jgi:hypothetical protein
VFIQLPGHDRITLHNYVLRVKTRHRKGPETYYFLVFMKSRRTATLLVNDYHLYFTHDREEYLYSLCYRLLGALVNPVLINIKAILLLLLWLMVNLTVR